MARKIFVLGIAVLFFYITSPLLLPVGFGGALAVLIVPVLERMMQRGLSRSLASALLTLLVTVIFLVPTAVLIFQGAKTAIQQLQAFKASSFQETLGGEGGWSEALNHTTWFPKALEWASPWLPVPSEQFVNTAVEFMRNVALRFTDLLGQFLTSLPGLTVALVLVIVSLYFFLVDGRRFVGFLRKNSVFSQQQTESLLNVLSQACRSVILASVVSGGVQAVFEFGLCWAMGVPNPVLIGLLVFLGSFVPVVGSAPATLGVVVHQLVMGRFSASIVLLVGAIFVAVIDNLVRPLFLKGTTNLHPLLAFIAAFGGLQAFGFTGIFLGPMIAVLFLATIQVLTRDPDSPIQL